MKYQGKEFKKHQRVKFVIPTDERIIDPVTDKVLWRYGTIQFFTKKSISAWILEDGAKENVRVSLFCISPLN
jgi:hypothetical protein